jgi:hypothetical protein
MTHPFKETSLFVTVNEIGVVQIVVIGFPRGDGAVESLPEA